MPVRAVYPSTLYTVPINSGTSLPSKIANRNGRFKFISTTDGGSMGVEASSLNGVITLCIENKAEMPGLSAVIRTAFEKEDITVLEAVDLDE